MIKNLTIRYENGAVLGLSKNFSIYEDRSNNTIEVTLHDEAFHAFILESLNYGTENIRHFVLSDRENKNTFHDAYKVGFYDFVNKMVTIILSKP